MIHLPCLGGGYTIVEAIMDLAAYGDRATDSGIRDARSCGRKWRRTSTG